jgi:HSP20 family molecular chaperone IbpA
MPKLAYDVVLKWLKHERMSVMLPWNLFPFNKKFNNQMGQLDQNEIENFIKQVLGQVMPPQMQGMMNGQDWLKQQQQQAEQNTAPSAEALSYSVFDTHNDVFVRIRIKDEDWLKKLKLYYTSNQLIVEHIPNTNDRTTITLPSVVKRKGTHTSYKDSILEVKIPKHIDLQYSEIEVSE